MADKETPDPHDALNEPAADPDPTEWPDPYDKRPDPRDPDADALEMDFGDAHTPTGATSTQTTMSSPRWWLVSLEAVLQAIEGPLSGPCGASLTRLQDSLDAARCAGCSQRGS